MHARFSARHVLTVVVHFRNKCSCMSHHVLQASTLGMVPPRYVWITYGWYPESFWKQSQSNGTSYQAFDQCSREQILNIINQMIFIHHFPRYDQRDKGNPIIGNLVRSKVHWSSLGIHFKKFDNTIRNIMILSHGTFMLNVLTLYQTAR